MFLKSHFYCIKRVIFDQDNDQHLYLGLHAFKKNHSTRKGRIVGKNHTKIQNFRLS